MGAAKSVLAIAGTALLGGCAQSLHRSADVVSIADSVSLSLPHPGELESEVRATQLLSGRYEGEAFDLQLNLEWRRDAIVVAAFSHFGNTLFSMSYDGEELTTIGNRLVLRGLDTSYVLADILITFSDTDILASHLDGMGLELVDTTDGRTILRDGSPIIRIEYEEPSRWTGRVQFSHLERRYAYEIETVQLTII